MEIVCPVCGRPNTVVNDYKPGSILSCRCGVHLQFVGPNEPAKPVSKDRPLYPTGDRQPKVS